MAQVRSCDCVLSVKLRCHAQLCQLSTPLGRVSERGLSTDYQSDKKPPIWGQTLRFLEPNFGKTSRSKIQNIAVTKGFGGGEPPRGGRAMCRLSKLQSQMIVSPRDDLLGIEGLDFQAKKSWIQSQAFFYQKVFYLRAAACRSGLLSSLSAQLMWTRSRSPPEKEAAAPVRRT